MIRLTVMAAVAAAALVTATAGADAQGTRERRVQSSDQFPRQQAATRSRGPDLYSVQPGAGGTITARTPNQSGNFGGPGTGGGNTP